MTLDDRIRRAVLELHEASAGLTPVSLPSRATIFRRRAVVIGAFAAAAAVIVLLAVPGALMQLGIQEVNTADSPPTESERKRDDGLGTGESSERGSLPPRGEQRVQTGEGTQGTGASRLGDSDQRGSAWVPRVAVPVAAGTYSYDLSGYFCGELATGCLSARERKDTYDRPSGSHQRSTSRWTTSGGRFDAEYGYDFRPDGVYWEHFKYTVTDNNGVVRDTFACPELTVTPYLVWPAGAKPGDHFEDTRPCNPYVLESRDSRTIVDILRAETVSVGGREVSTLFIRVQWRRSNNRYNITEGWVFPDHYLFVKEDLSWSTEHNHGEYHTMLESLNPS